MPEIDPGKCEAHAVGIAEHGVRMDNLEKQADGMDKHIGSLERRLTDGDNALHAKIQGVIDGINTLGNRGWVQVANIVTSVASPIVVAYLILKFVKGG